MLRKIRIALAALFFIAITALFVDPTGTVAGWFGWMAKLQFLPSVLALNVAVIVGIILLTLIFGRLYCSVICPMGVFQDLVSHLRGRIARRNRFRFGFTKELKWLRYGVWVIFVIAIFAGVQAFVAILAPYSAYGRMVSSFFGSGLKAMPVVVVAVVTLVAIFAAAWFGGRAYCNAICPVGTTLGFFSRFALLRPVIDLKKCEGCGLCGRSCKSSCIDTKSKKIDGSRCVACFDCIGICRAGAISYKFAYGNKSGAEPVSEKANAEALSSQTKAKAEPLSSQTKANADSSRRAFLTVGALALGTAAMNAQDKKRDGGFATILPKTKPERAQRLVPFGSRSVKDFYDRCTACQLCVCQCPNKVLRPSTDLEHFMQPEMSYEKGYCRPECVRCSDVCPAGAILPITPEEKTAIHIGTAQVDYDLCVVNRDGVKCGNCARHCPAGAIMMVRKDPDDANSLMIPTVNESRCIGCGACENLCPSRPLSAITVNGLAEHR